MPGMRAAPFDEICFTRVPPARRARSVLHVAAACRRLIIIHFSYHCLSEQIILSAEVVVGFLPLFSTTTIRHSGTHAAC